LPNSEYPSPRISDRENIRFRTSEIPGSRGFAGGDPLQNPIKSTYRKKPTKDLNFSLINESQNARSGSKFDSALPTAPDFKGKGVTENVRKPFGS
jgi:hypothetical protein